MHEPALLSRRALAALSIAALAGAPRSAAAADDAALLDLGSQWAAAWNLVVAHDRAMQATFPTLTGDEVHAMEVVGDKLYDAEQVLFRAIEDIPARTVARLAIKAQILARTHDVEDRGIKAVEAAAEGAWELTTRATFSLVLDVLKLAQVAA